MYCEGIFEITSICKQSKNLINCNLELKDHKKKCSIKVITNNKLINNNGNGKYFISARLTDANDYDMKNLDIIEIYKV